MDYEQFLELVKTRRSIRTFKPDLVPSEYIEKILETAHWAPSGANSQPWEFIVVTDEEIKDKLVNVITQNSSFWQGLKAPPVFIIVCGDTRRKIFFPGAQFEMVNGKIKLKERPNLNSDNVFNSSLANAFLYIQLAIRTLGLGSRWLSSTRMPKIQSEIKRLLKMPEYLVIYDTVFLGYPAGSPRSRMVRNLEEITHYNQYDASKSKTDEELASLSKESIKELRNILNKQ